MLRMWSMNVVEYAEYDRNCMNGVEYAEYDRN